MSAPAPAVRPEATALDGQRADADVIVVGAGPAGSSAAYWLATAGLAVYAIFLLVTPFAHHDLLCELKTPTHCTACTSSLLSADPNTPVLIGASDLADAGGALAADVLTTGFLLAVRSTGRSPPSASIGPALQSR